MTVSLSPQLEEIVQKKLDSGRYGSASEVVREALQLLDEQDRLEELRLVDLRKEIAVGIDQLDQGDYTEYNEQSLPALAQDIKARGRERLADKFR